MQVRPLAVGAQSRPAPGVDARALLDRQALEDVVQVALDVLQLVGLQDALEYIEAAAPVGLDNFRMEFPRGGEADRATIAQGGGAAFAVAEIGLHGGLFRAVVTIHGSSSDTTIPVIHRP
jgi:hypothetical protein